MDKHLVISLKTILLALLMILAGYVIYRLGPIIGILLIAFLLVISIEPLVKRIMKFTVLNKPVARSVAVIISYLFLIIIFASTMTLIVPPVVSQLQKMFVGVSQIANKYNITDLDFSIADLLPQAKSVSSGVLSVTLSVFSNVATVFSLLIISVYMSLDWVNLKKRFLKLFSPKVEEDVEDTLHEIENNVGNWVKGQLLLMLVVGSMSFLGLLLLDVRYPLALGLVAGLLEIVPIMGPILSAVLAGIIGFADAPIKGMGVIALFIVIQQLENNILVPKIMQKVSGFRPLLILLALLIGSEFFGIIGAIIAVPMTMILVIILKKVLHHSG